MRLTLQSKLILCYLYYKIDCLGTNHCVPILTKSDSMNHWDFKIYKLQWIISKSILFSSDYYSMSGTNSKLLANTLFQAVSPVSPNKCLFSLSTVSEFWVSDYPRVWVPQCPTLALTKWPTTWVSKCPNGSSSLCTNSNPNKRISLNFWSPDDSVD